MVDELYAYFLKRVPSLFFLSISSTSHVSLRVTLVWKNGKIMEKTALWDCLIIDHSLINVWLLATVEKSQSGSGKKSISAYCNTHEPHTMAEWNTLSDVKTPLKKTLYIRYSFSQRSRSFKKDEISTICDGLHEQIHFLTIRWVKRFCLKICLTDISEVDLLVPGL